MGISQAYAYFLASYKKSLIYKYNVLLRLLGVFILVGTQYYIWTSIMIKSDSKVIYQALTYAIFSRLFVFILPGSHTVRFISDKIINGSIQIDLLRPIKLIVSSIFNDLGYFVFNFIFLLLPSIVVIFLFFDIKIYYLNLYFFESLFLSIILAFLISYCIGLLSMWFGNIWGINEFYTALVSIFGGSLIPLQFYPEWLRFLAMILPFQSIYFTPLAFFSGIVENSFSLIIVQLSWVIIFIVVTFILELIVRAKMAYMGG
ncbi:ABC transporter permease [Paenibacillus campi]|uniref:ABC transporter permease n=1 Tax=Paenibacillus campi TaxID=3106031 RepID=UPI002AFF78FF|nr:ABC-2 family transporter protein [Paenibacillus sp. SGZ-1014]